MDKLSIVEWSWDCGKVNSKLTFESGKIELRENNHPPPTKACHDISHFICGLNGNLDWDYETEANHISEYNAVFLEVLLSNFCHCHYYECPIDVENNMHYLVNYMKWFSEEYYMISKNHPSKKTHIELRNNFLQHINFKIVCNYFLQFYRVWIIEEIYKNPNFKTEILMNSTLDYSFSPLYNYLIESKRILLNQFS